MASDRDEGTEPSFREGLRGSAHLYDMIRSITGARDPRTRELVDDLDKISLDDILSMGDELFKRRDDIPEPHVEIVDTDYGVEVVVDTQGSPVEAANVDARVIGDGDAVMVEASETGWYIKVGSKDTDDTIEDVSTLAPRGDVVTIAISYESGEGISPADASAPSFEEAAGDGDHPFVLDREVDADRLAEGRAPAPTVNEAIREHKWFHELLLDGIGENRVQMLRTFYGDVKVTEVPFDLGDPSSIEEIFNEAESMEGDQPDDGGAADDDQDDDVVDSVTDLDTEGGASWPSAEADVDENEGDGEESGEE